MEARTVCDYRIWEKIGEGGNGGLELAADTLRERKTALKFQPVNLDADPVVHKRSSSEAHVAATKHPDLCRIKKAAQRAEGQDYIVLVLAG